MTNDLNNKNWKVFQLNDIFINYHGKRLTKEYRSSGQIPLLTASAINQGISDFIAKNLNMTQYHDFISVDMFGHAFYHDYLCYGDDNIYFLKNDKISKNAKIFIVTCINKNSSKYSYGRQFRQDNADKDKIMLPVNSAGEPDYEFMEGYIKELKDKLKQKYKKHILDTINNSVQTVEQNKKCKAFCISDIFDIKAGKRLKKVDMQKGSTPFIGAADNGNGITNYVSNINSSLDKNVLGVNYDGNGVAVSFYHPYSCLFTDSVKRFHLKNHQDNKYVLLFMKSVILKQKSKYMYGYKFCESRMLRQKIMLPVNSAGEPDYKYMENYMKYLEQQKVLEYFKCMK